MNQCNLVVINRNGYWYVPRPDNDNNNNLLNYQQKFGGMILIADMINKVKHMKQQF